MRQKYTVDDYRRVLGKDLEESGQIEEKIKGAYAMIRMNQESRSAARRKKGVKGLIRGMSAVAAALILSVTAFVASPALAAKFSFIGNIFGSVEKDVSYQGDYSKDATQLVNPEEVGEDGTIDSPYVQTDQGITFTISECNYESMAMYLAVSVESEAGFSEDFRTYPFTGESGEGERMDYQTLYITSTAAADFAEAGSYKWDPAEGTEPPYYIEGKFADEHTFVGIIRVDLMHMEIPNDQIPEEFSYHLCVTDLFTDPDPKKEHLEGTWEFDLDVKLNSAGTVVKEINETNEKGIGIGKVIKTSYELNAELVLPESENAMDYIVAVCDAEGKLLESQGYYAEIYSLYGRDVSKVFIYVVDYVTFMDECKGNNAYLLPEKAVFQTEVTF